MDFKLDASLASRSIFILPHHYTSNSTSSTTLLYFSLAILDILQVEIAQKEDIIKYLYSLYTGSGFRGSQSIGSGALCSEYDRSHITMTYTALLSLLILGDNLGGINKPEIIKELKSLQLPSGSFIPFNGSGECDLRFIYCAVAVSHILNDFDGLNQDSIIKYIVNCVGFDGGIGQGRELESHGGSTYCAIATLKILNRLDAIDSEAVLYWCLNRQSDGFSGRVGKSEDTCYSFWIGATICMLGARHLVDTDALFGFLSQTHHKDIGGFGKEEGCWPDLLHSYMGLAGLGLFGYEGVEEVNCELNVRNVHLARVRDF